MNINSTSLAISIMFISLYIVNESYNILYLSFFRYFKRELVPKGAIDVQALPKYFAAWIQKGSDQCIYTAQQLKRYKQPHLHAGCWYLDCVRGFVFDSEAEVKTLHDGGVEVEEDTTQVIEDDEGHQDQSSAPPPKPKRGHRLRRGTDIVSLGSESQASELGQTESSAPLSQTLLASQSKVVLETAPSSMTVPSSVSALEMTRGLIEQRKAKLFPTSTSSSGIPHSAHVFVSSISVETLMTSHTKLSDNGGDPRWVQILDFIRKVQSVASTRFGCIRFFLHIIKSNFPSWFLQDGRRPPNPSSRTVRK